METQEITIRVSQQAASLYEAASEEERRKLGLLLSLKLGEVQRGKKRLEEIMSEISQKAKARGLMPEILESHLNES